MSKEIIQVKTHFNGWMTVSEEAANKWANVMREQALGLAVEKKEEYIKSRTRRITTND